MATNEELAETNNGYGAHVVASGGAMQQVRTSHTTAVAVQRPRSLMAVSRRLEEEATLSGERFYYGWGAGNSKIEGPSIKLANAAARCWGNCAIELLPVQDLPDSWVFTAIFVDLETGFTTPRQFRMSKKYPVHGKHDEARKEDIRFQIGQSKAIRNVILNALPAGIIDNAMEAAKSGVRQKIEKFIAETDAKEGKGKGLVKAVDSVIQALSKHGVKEEAIFRKLEIADRKAITVDRLVILRGDLAALSDGEARIDDLYPAPQAKGVDFKPDAPAQPTQTPLQFHTQAIGDAETQAELEAAYAAAFDDDNLSKSDRARIASLRDERRKAIEEAQAFLRGGSDERQAHEATK